MEIIPGMGGWLSNVLGEFHLSDFMGFFFFLWLLWRWWYLSEGVSRGVNPG